MHLLCALMALLAAPFWEAKAPREWSDAQIQELLHDSPWARMSDPQPLVQVYLASARPMREAEEEWARRRGKKLNEDYLDYLANEGANKIILAIGLPIKQGLADEAESRRMEQESVMRVGRKTYKIEGQFPPVPSDPFLRLVFPRAVTEGDKGIVFELYLPENGPYHQIEFPLRDLRYKGKLEL